MKKNLFLASLLASSGLTATEVAILAGSWKYKEEGGFLATMISKYLLSGWQSAGVWGKKHKLQKTLVVALLTPPPPPDSVPFLLTGKSLIFSMWLFMYAQERWLQASPNKWIAISPSQEMQSRPCWHGHVMQPWLTGHKREVYWGHLWKIFLLEKDKGEKKHPPHRHSEIMFNLAPLDPVKWTRKFSYDTWLLCNSFSITWPFQTRQWLIQQSWPYMCYP